MYVSLRERENLPPREIYSLRSILANSYGEKGMTLVVSKKKTRSPFFISLDLHLISFRRLRTFFFYGCSFTKIFHIALDCTCFSNCVISQLSITLLSLHSCTRLFIVKFIIILSFDFHKRFKYKDSILFKKF